MTPRRWLFLFLGALTLLRLAFAAQLELFPDESYYFMWSERMDSVAVSLNWLCASC